MENVKLNYKVIKHKRKNYTVVIEATYFNTREDAIEFIESCAFETEDFFWQRVH